jgi:hypothetical protein
MRGFFKRWQERRRERGAIETCLDALFMRPELLRQGRLRPDHRRRVVVLEKELDDEQQVKSLRLGIVRHPKAHPMQPRGEEVLEILDYDVVNETIEVAGSRNLTRKGKGPEEGTG